MVRHVQAVAMGAESYILLQRSRRSDSGWSKSKNQGSQTNAYPKTHNPEDGSPERFLTRIDQVVHLNQRAGVSLSRVYWELSGCLGFSVK